MSDTKQAKIRHHAVSLAKGSAHHVGALLLMTALRGILITAIGTGGIAAVSAFLPDEMRAPEASASHVVAPEQAPAITDAR